MNYDLVELYRTPSFKKSSLLFLSHVFPDRKSADDKSFSFHEECTSAIQVASKNERKNKENSRQKIINRSIRNEK